MNMRAQEQDSGLPRDRTEETSWLEVRTSKKKTWKGVKGEARPLTLAGLGDRIGLLAELLHP